MLVFASLKPVEKLIYQNYWSLGLTGLCKAMAAAASSMAGPLLSLEEAAEALRCCWCERREPREPLDPSEL